MSTLREALSNLPGAAFADLLESDDAYLIVLDLPGATAETSDVRVEGRRVKIEAQRAKDTPDGFRYTREGRSLFIDAEFPLPLDASGADASASVQRGVLELRLPKTSGSGGRSIPVEDA